MIAGMKPPMFVRFLTADERQQLQTGLRSRHPFTIRRCQILLASARGERASQIARTLGCATQTVRNVIGDFQCRGLLALTETSRRPKTVQPLLDDATCQQLKALLHTSPRQFGKPTSLWTLKLVAEVVCEQGLVNQSVSGELIRRALKRLGVKWKRAKLWISSPDPQYALKKTNCSG